MGREGMIAGQLRGRRNHFLLKFFAKVFIPDLSQRRPFGASLRLVEWTVAGLEWNAVIDA
jgi:hypothetical protein